MFLLPKALLTCLFFLAFCGIIDLAINAVLYIGGRFDLFHGFIAFGRLFSWVLFGALWCLSFYFGSRVEHAIWRSTLPPHLHH
jgi:1,4-dihydroxy-2-naphthoate octaprenyltransferase